LLRTTEDTALHPNSERENAGDEAGPASRDVLCRIVETQYDEPDSEILVGPGDAEVGKDNIHGGTLELGENRIPLQETRASSVCIMNIMSIMNSETEV
jgi:hypothetical protein